ncbi:glutamine amidotransferase-related protein [Bradyrhizobium genosp. SA-3]|uniref:glutamine amidotransferase-related protein n=1 Tax=Bradyrhizobium genosp. SA-3 TaxID=508868 RepID=UPI0010292DB5
MVDFLTLMQDLVVDPRFGYVPTNMDCRVDHVRVAPRVGGSQCARLLSPWSLRWEHAASCRVPILGICLGHQVHQEAFLADA